MENKKKLPGFSVLLPIYYKETVNNLNQCLESLAAQTLPAAEIIIVKDGLLPNELNEVLILWQGKLPLKIIGYEENKGLAYALNYGIQFCTCEFIARMDSDDICAPNRFEKQIKYFEEHDKTVIIGSNILEFYEDKNIINLIGERKYPVFTNKKSKSLFKGTPIAHPTMVIKTELLKKYKYNENTYLNEDIDLWFRLLIDGYSIENINELLLKYRITDKLFKRRNYRKAVNELKIYCKNLILINGFSLMLIFPLLRFFSRLLPAFCIKKIYLSKGRKKLYHHNDDDGVL